MYNKNYKNKKGFTLVELLIVVAIIAVLVSIAIPVLTVQLEKTREAPDLANVRAAYAKVMAAAMLEDKSAEVFKDGMYQMTVSLKQKQDDWQSYPVTIANVTVTKGKPQNDNWKGYPKPNGSCTVSYKEERGVLFDWNGTPDGSTSGGQALANNILSNGGFSESDNGWELINGAKIEDAKATLSSGHKGGVIKQNVNLEEGKEYIFTVDVEKCGAPLDIRISNRNGNVNYLTENVTKDGKVEYRYKHEKNRDNNVQVSLHVFESSEKLPVTIKYVHLTEAK